MRFLAIMIVASCCLAAGGSLDRARAGASDTSWVEIGPSGRGGRGFVVYPAVEASVPAVIVVHGEQGLTPRIKDFARRLSLQGYVVLVPELRRASAVGQGTTQDELAIEDLAAAVQWLRGARPTLRSKIGVIGFSTGAAPAIARGIATPSIAAVALFDGPPDADPAELARLKAPLQAHFGADDARASAHAVEALRAVSARPGGNAGVYVYPGAGHAFMNEDLFTYHPDSARLAWARLLAFLQKHLKG